MAKYGAKRRPLSCEMNLSVIQEEGLDSLRQQGPARGHPRLEKRRSLSVTNDFMLKWNEVASEGEDEQGHDGGAGEEEPERGEESWDGAAGLAQLPFVDRQATADDGGDLSEGGLSEGETLSSDECDGADLGGSAGSEPPLRSNAEPFAVSQRRESAPEHTGLVPLLRTMSKTSLDNFEIDSVGRVVVSRARAGRAQSADLSAQKKGRRSPGVLSALWKRTSNIMKRGFQEVDLAASLEFAETSSLFDRRSSYTSQESLPGAYRLSVDNESSPFPVSRRGVNGLRQCDSLENVCDSSHEDQIENGLGLAAQPAAANAISLPHIHHLSDYDDDTAGHDTNTENDQENDLAKSTSGKPRQGKQGNKRSDKSKKTKLKRRRAYYRSQKDGRSKSLTHIDTLGESGMLLPGDEMGGRAGEPPTDKLGVPDPHSVRRRKLSLANKREYESKYAISPPRDLHNTEPEGMLAESREPCVRKSSCREKHERNKMNFPINRTSPQENPMERHAQRASRRRSRTPFALRAQGIRRHENLASCRGFTPPSGARGRIGTPSPWVPRGGAPLPLAGSWY
ncbi:uncharacterized protein LOC134771335 [Penaeus indicus]|uniref:uncharacterized protein LOC134771335 n=1 Tax=Penaeus indicus TaxID=29960 RepID=UPI00300C9FC8